MDALYRAYFSATGDLFTVGGLVTVAADAGLDSDAARTALTSGAYTARVDADEMRARRLGITGVPFFLFDEKYAVCGGQAVEVLQLALDQAWSPVPSESPPLEMKEK